MDQDKHLGAKLLGILMLFQIMIWKDFLFY